MPMIRFSTKKLGELFDTVGMNTKRKIAAMVEISMKAPRNRKGPTICMMP